jgi:uncharacterized protein (DUF2384 family)
MDYSLNIKQQEIMSKLRAIAGSDGELDLWLSTPNKEFRGKAPIDMLRQEEYQYFAKVIAK